MTSSDRHFRGIGFAVAGFTLWVAVDAFIKLAAEAGVPSYEIVGALGFIGAACMALRSLRRGGIKSLWPGNLRGQSVLVSLSVAINYTNVIALKHLPLTFFYVAIFTAPMMMAVIAAFFLKEPLGWLKFLVIVAGFGGVIIAVDPWQNASGGDATGYIAAFAAATSFAVYMVLSRFLMRRETPESMTFFNGAVVALTGIIAAIVTGDLPVPPMQTLFILLAAGILNAGANLCSFLAVKYAPTATIAPYHYTQIIAGALVAFLVWHDMPTLHLIAGAAVIIASGLYIAAHTKKTVDALPGIAN